MRWRRRAALWAASIAILVAAGALGRWAWRSLRSDRLSGEPQVAPITWELGYAAQETAKPFKTVPLRESTDISDLASRILEALPEEIPVVVSGFSGEEAVVHEVSREAVRAPLEFVLSFLIARSAGDAEVYAAWAKGHGLRLPASFDDAPPFTRRWFRKVHLFMTGSDMPADMDPQAFFETMYALDATRNAGAFRPVAVVVEPPAVEAAMAENIRSFTDLRLFTTAPPTRPDTLGSDFWRGGASMRAVRFWRSQEDMPPEDEAPGSLPPPREGATVWLVVQGASGLRVPMLFGMVRSPGSDRWRIELLYVNNVTEDPQGRLLREESLYIY